MVVQRRPLVLGIFIIVSHFGSPGLGQHRPARTYETAPTDISRLGLRTLAATVPPIDLSAQAAAQRVVSAEVADTLKELGQPSVGAPFGDARDDCKVSLRKFDWRDHGGVTAVRNQDNCGECFVFGAMGAFEQLLDCAKAGPCGGGWHVRITGGTQTQWMSRNVLVGEMTLF